MSDHNLQAAERASAVPSLLVSAVVASSVRLWRRDLRLLSALAAVLELPLVVAEIALHITPGLRTLVDESFTLTGAALAVFVYGSLSHHFLAGLLERVVASERRGHARPGLGTILRDLPWRRLVIADLLLTGAVAVGLALFVVPGLVLLTWFAVTLPIVNLERNPVLPSFARSYRLVRGHSWRVFAVALVVFAVPAVLIWLAGWLAHRVTDDAVVVALAHAVPAVILMPLAALPIVTMAFQLVDLDRR
jgi:hypothetical protein